MGTEEQLTPEEAIELRNFLVGQGINAASPEEKHTVHTFLHKISIAQDTTKTGYLMDEEVGVPLNPVRTFKKLALISEKIVDNKVFNEFFTAESEIITSTSLSRKGKLLNAAVTSKRQLEDVTRKRSPSGSWFKRKDKDEDEKGGD